MKKHIHKWKLSKTRVKQIERACTECDAVQHADMPLEAQCTLPPSLIQLADVEWMEGKLPPLPPPSYGYGPYGGFP